VETKNDQLYIWAGLLILAVFVAMTLGTFAIYTNRYGKKLVMLRSVRAKFFLMQDELAKEGTDIEMTDAWRGEADQEKALKAGNSLAGFGQSPHNYGAAFDVAPVIQGKLRWDVDKNVWLAIGKAGKQAGLIWGGEFHSIVDKPHFELPGWRDMDLALLYEAPEVYTT
jgi:hypothetical protein